MSDYRRFQNSGGTWKIYEPQFYRRKYVNSYRPEDNFDDCEDIWGLDCDGLANDCRGCIICEGCPCSDCFGFNNNHIEIIKFKNY